MLPRDARRAEDRMTRGAAPSRRVRPSTPAPTRRSGRRRCGRAGRRAFLARACRNSASSPGAGVQRVTLCRRSRFVDGGAAKPPTRSRSARRHGSWPHRARQSSHATPHGSALWKLAAPGAAKSQRDPAGLGEHGSLPRWPGRGAQPRGGQPVNRYDGTTRLRPRILTEASALD